MPFVAAAPRSAPPAVEDADRATDDLGTAVIALVRAWRAIARHNPERSRYGAVALETAVLLGDGEYRLSELAELRGVDQSVISRQIGELEARRLVDRRPDPTDRRAHLVRLTAAGRELLVRAGARNRAWLRDALVRMPAADARAAARLVAVVGAELAARAHDLDRAPPAGPARPHRPSTEGRPT